MKLFANIIPVTPPNEKLNKNPIIKNTGVMKNCDDEYIELNQLNSFIPVGIAIILVAVEKYARVSKSNPTINI
jgi:hypothetical protein